MTLVWRPGYGGVPGKVVLLKESQPLDADAEAYVNAVEVADGQRIEDPVRFAINNFVIGCKADGIWNAIKASCILAGARTLAGALVPLKGAAPTNVGGLFVQADYNRKTGLVGDGSTKYLNSNRNNNADPQNSFHLATYASTIGTTGYAIAAGGSETGTSMLGLFFNVQRSRTGLAFNNAGGAAGFNGHSRSASGSYTHRAASTNTTLTATSETPANLSLLVFARGTAASPASLSNARLAFYSIGESLNLALLDARVTALINAIGAAIP